MKKALDRRSFLRVSALTGAFMGIPGLGLAGRKVESEEILDRISQTPKAHGKSVMGLRVDPIKQVRVGIIGLGNRGSGMSRHIEVMSPDKAKVVAICDIQENKADRVYDRMKKNGHNPDVYKGDKDAWKKLVERDDIDLVLVFTNWEWHVPMCVYAMQKGKHVATEVPASYTIEDTWKLVNTAEETQRNCMMLENVCYGNEELWILNMVQEGIFGTLTYGEAAYIHNLRGMLFGNSYYNQWRIRHHMHRDGNLYTTHGLGPVAQYMDIDRGDRFKYMTSMSSLEASLSETSPTVKASDEFYGKTGFKHGDMNTSLIKTAKGRMIHLYHDVVTPRPYSRKNCLAGTKGYHEGYPSRLAMEGKGHGWLKDEDYKAMREKYNHPIWDRLKKEIEMYGGHGGMDFVEMYRMIDCFNKGLPLDMDVYDAASWSVVGPLSEISVELGSACVQFPDFTRGNWKIKRKLGILTH